MTPPLRIALHQALVGPHARAVDGAVALEGAVARASAAGADLLVTPELSLTGYAPEDGTPAVEPPDGPAFRVVAGAAARHRVAVAYGYADQPAAATKPTNAVCLVGPDGTPLARYHKTHLYGGWEHRTFAPGQRLVVQADLGGLRVGLLVCYDVEFPEAVRAHALAGTDLLLVPTALMRPYDVVARTLVPARAWENQLYLAYVNHCGDQGDLGFTGLSCLAAPDGTVPALSGAGAELLVADVDPVLLSASREANPYLTDRSPELYGRHPEPYGRRR